MNSNYLNKIPVRQPHSKGFTLLELIIVLLIGSILLAWGVPGYQSLKARRMVTEFSNEVIYSFTLARAEAVRYGTNVEIVPNGNWQDGWTITAKGVDGSGDVIIAVQDAVDSALGFTQSGNSPGSVTFNSIGGLAAGSEAEFGLANNHYSGVNRTIRINSSGSAKVITP